MAINETIASGKYRQCIDEINKIWKRYSLWNKAADTECEDGQTVEEKVGAIKGITTDLNVTDTGYAADVTMLTQLYSDMEMLRNHIAAVDTRVTNAINGGDLAAPFTLNMLNTAYQNSIIADNGTTSLSSLISIYRNTTTILTYKGICTFNYYMIRRLYNTAVKIVGTKYKAVIRARYYNSACDSECALEVLDASTNAVLLMSNAFTNSFSTQTLSLSSLNGKTVKFRIAVKTKYNSNYERGFVLESFVVNND